MQGERLRTNGSGAAVINASRAAIAQATGQLPPGEHIVTLRAQAFPESMTLLVVGLSTEQRAGTGYKLDRLFNTPPDDPYERKAFTAQGNFWFNLLTACSLPDAVVQNVTLEQLATLLNDKQVVAGVNQRGFWSWVRAL
jgi:hypothetical protein